MVRISTKEELCLRCKGGKFLCGLTYCPILIRTKALIPIRKVLSKLKNEYYGPSPPSLFVGRFGYPYVKLGPMAALNWQNIEFIDEPDLWKTSMSLEDIVNFRAKLFRFTAEPVKITDTSSSTKILEITQEQIQATSPVDIEIKFSKKPRINMKFDRFTQPVGTQIQVDSIQLASSPRINSKIEYVISDGDLNTIPAVESLYNSKTTVTQITRLLSAGLLGLTKNRKFVPTRWSITAIDDMIGNRLRRRISDYSAINDYMVFHNSYLDNDFWVLFIPKREWHFDYHEAWKMDSAWNRTSNKPIILSDTEGPHGRKNYASNTVGGYYAARLAVLEKLEQFRRKAAVLAFREVGKGYAIPLGVWQVRENMRKALNNPHDTFNNLESALTFIEKRLTIPMRFYRQNSLLLKQKTLDAFLKTQKNI
jgi:hypothetical protein